MPKDAPDPVIIKKYGNRRLYDTRQSQYITLEDLAGIVRSGSQVKVVEASTDRDLTRQVLTQVILEQQEALELVPVELLHAVIRVQGTLEQAPFSAFLTAVTGQLVSRGNLFAQQLASLMGALPGPFAGSGTFPGSGAAAPGRGQAAPGFGAGAPDRGEAAPGFGAGDQGRSEGDVGRTEEAPPRAGPAMQGDAGRGEGLSSQGGSGAQGETDLASVRKRMDALLRRLQK